MDGNNRFSKKNKISLFESYRLGADNLLKICDFIFDNYKTNYISAFGLSHNNTKRPKRILQNILKVLDFFLEKEIYKKEKYNFNILIKGDLSFFSNETVKKINNFMISQKKYKKKLIIYLNYSGQMDIITAANKIKKRDFNFKNFKNSLLTKDYVDPDLLIRTGGYQRISDFFLFQIAFTELYFIKKLWPEFNKLDIKKIFLDFKNIERKFGY